MRSKPTVSVCMAAWNGSAYIAHQIASILEQLGPEDELVIVDDASTDDTVEVVRSFHDDRIRLSLSTVNRGYVRTFEAAMTLARNEVILLSDQDDEWIPGRVEEMLAAASEAGVVASNLVLLGDDAPLPHPLTRRPWRLPARRRPSPLYASAILAGVAPYFGCAMAVRRDMLPAVLPFPRWLTESHDLWIASVGLAAHEMVHLDTPTIRRRLHDSNASPSRPRGIRAVMRARVMLVRAQFTARSRVRAASRH
jgi:glycosyltransferase involved in cell wall biosynthesis